MHRRKRARGKGISPVIASIVLIGVTIAVSVALGGWIFGLFGGYATGSAVKTISANMTTAASPITVYFSNSGGAADTVNKVTLDVAGTSYEYTSATGYDGIISANTASEKENFSNASPPTTLTAGQTVTFKIYLASGITLSQVAVVG